MGWRGVSEIESEVQEQKKQKTPVLIVIWTWTQHFTDAEQNKWLCTVQQLSLTSFHTQIITEYEWQDLMKQMHTGVSTHFVFRMFIFQMWHRGIFEESDYIKKFRLCLCVCAVDGNGMIIVAIILGLLLLGILGGVLYFLRKKGMISCGRSGKQEMWVAPLFVLR